MTCSRYPTQIVTHPICRENEASRFPTAMLEPWQPGMDRYFAVTNEGEFKSYLQSKTYAADDTSDQELSDFPRATLKTPSYEHEAHAEPNSCSSAQAVSQVKARQSSHQRSELERSNDDALHTGVVHLGEYGGKRIFGDQTALRAHQLGHCADMRQPTMMLISYPKSQKAHVAMPATAKLRRRPSRPMVAVYGVSFNILVMRSMTKMVLCAID